MVGRGSSVEVVGVVVGLSWGIEDGELFGIRGIRQAKNGVEDDIAF